MFVIHTSLLNQLRPFFQIGPATAAQQAAASASAAAAKPGEVTKRPYNKKPLRTDRAAPEKVCTSQSMQFAMVDHRALHAHALSAHM